MFSLLVHATNVQFFDTSKDMIYLDIEKDF